MSIFSILLEPRHSFTVDAVKGDKRAASSCPGLISHLHGAVTMSPYSSNRARHRLHRVFILDWMLARIDAHPLSLPLSLSLCTVPFEFSYFAALSNILETMYTELHVFTRPAGASGFARSLPAHSQPTRNASADKINLFLVECGDLLGDGVSRLD